MYKSIDSVGGNVGPKKDHRPIVAVFYMTYIIIIFFLVKVLIIFVIATIQTWVLQYLGSPWLKDFEDADINGNQVCLRLLPS